MYPTVGTRQVVVLGVLMAFLLLVFWCVVVLS